MTIEVFEAAPIYDIAGTGPYPIPHPYSESAIRVTVLTDDQAIHLTSDHYSVAPASAEVSGDVTLDAGVAAEYAGGRLVIDRQTTDEQGWRGIFGERERGLERQLDAIVMAVQEVRQQLGQSLRTYQQIDRVHLGEDRVMVYRDGQIVPGPTPGQIESAAAMAAEIGNLLAEAELYTIGSLAALRASTDALPVGVTVSTRREGFAFQVIPAPEIPDLFTAGGVLLRALPDAAGFVHIEQFGAVPDGNRYTGAGTDNTVAIRRAFATDHHIRIGRGIYRITGTVWNIKENRITDGAGMGMACSSPDTVTLFNPPSCLLATGSAARRVITRRRKRPTSAAPNDPALSAVLENWGGGAEFRNFSIELYCDYTDYSPTNFGADWDIGFYNGCRSNVSCNQVTILGYFRAAGFYWDVTDGFAIPQLLDPDGVPFPGPGDPRWTARSSGADHCRMTACQVRGARVGLAILGADRARQSGNEGYYDWVSGATIAGDNRGVSGCSDFRDRDSIIYSVNHHSGWRSQDPIGWGAPLTRANMEAEGDFAPAAVYIDVWANNDNSASGPAHAARGILLDSMRVNSFEMFRIRLDQCKEVIMGTRTWSEGGDGLYDLHAADGTPLASSSEYVNITYGHLATTPNTGLVVWENTVDAILANQWVYDWRWVRMIDRVGRQRGQDQGFENVAAATGGSIRLLGRSGGYIAIAPNGVGTGAVLPSAAAKLYFDIGSTPVLQPAGHEGANVTLLPPSTNPGPDNTPAGNISYSAWPGEIRYYNRLTIGGVILPWRLS